MGDVNKYYARVREAEAAITDEFPIIVSLGDDTGAKAGVTAEVNRKTAARMIAGLTHRLAKPEEIEAHRARIAEGQRKHTASEVESSVRTLVDRMTGIKVPDLTAIPPVPAPADPVKPAAPAKDKKDEGGK